MTDCVRAALLSILLIVLVCPVFESTSFAQVADSLGVADSLSVADSLDVAAVETVLPMRSPAFSPSVASDSTTFGRPVRRAELGLPALLGSEAGVFQFEFGTLGWPEPVSIEGGDPNRTMLMLDDMELDDLITGRPRYELLPYATIQSVGLMKSGPGINSGVVAYSNPYSDPRPQTDLRYRSGADGLTYIDAVHVQNRSLKNLWPGTRVQLLASYSGSSHTGDYPGSKLQTARQLQGRIRLQRPGWSLEIYELYNKQLVGAHSGVNPTDGTYDSIYNRFGATVTAPDAQRGTIRNDLRLTYRRYIAAQPTTVSFGWSSQRMTFVGSVAASETDSIDIRVHRFTVSLRQPVNVAEHALAIRFYIASDQYASGRPENKPEDESLFRLDATVSDSFSVGGVDVAASLGAHDDDGTFFPSASADLSHGVLSAAVSYTGIRSNWFDTRGAGTDFRPLNEIPEMRQFRTALSVRHEWKKTKVLLTAFYISVTNQVSLYGESQTGDFASVEKSQYRVGAYLDLTFRARGSRGLYASVRPTIIRDVTSTPSEPTLFENSMPDFWIEARIGIRRLLFKGDMDFDLSIRGSWSAAMLGRTLDSPSGLLFHQISPGISELSAAPRLDIVAEAGVKQATIFLSYENFLYGNNTGTGISFVPYYPVPASRFRFGLFWPIAN